MLKFIGKINRKEVNELYGRARTGIVIYQPAANHMESQPIKMFEFMAAGLPVVASNFPLWMEILGDAGCDICVDPTKAEEVRNACLYMLDHPEEAQQMGINGKKAVDQFYNWNNEKEKLIDLYRAL